MNAPMVSPLSVRERLLLVGGGALLVGYLEAALLVGRNVVGHTITGSDWDAFWLGSLAYLVIFLVAAVPLEVMVRWRPTWWSPGRYLMPFVGLGTACLLLDQFKLRLHPAAIGLLTIGVAFRVGRWVDGPLAGRRPAMIRSAAGLLVSWVPLALVLGMGPALHERWELGRRPASGERPNVLLIIWDTVRASDLSLYGYRYLTTPALDRWAKRGVVFDLAISPSCWTLPSHATIFTGRPHRDLNVGWFTGLDRRWPTLAERFQAGGYRTAGFAANWYYTTSQSGLDRGFDHYDDLDRTWRQALLYTMPGQLMDGLKGGRLNLKLFNAYRSAVRRNASRVTDRFLEWAGREDPHPFFAFLNYFDAHSPYQPGPSSEQLGPPTSPRARYDRLIRELDQDLERLLSELERRGTLRNTLVIITADHGEQFGEHGLSGHANSLYLPLLRVPLVVLTPRGSPEGVRIGTPVSLGDLSATVLDLAQLPTSDVPGRSLQECWSPGGCPFRSEDTLTAAVQGNRDADKHSPVFQGNLVTILTRNLHYIRNGDGREELYDFVSDTAEATNLADDSAWTGAVARLREASTVYELPPMPDR